MIEFIANYADYIVWGLVIILIILMVVCFYPYFRGIVLGTETKEDVFRGVVLCFLIVFITLCMYIVLELKKENAIATTLEEYGLELIDFNYNRRTSFYKTFALDNDGNYITLYLKKDTNGDYGVYTKKYMEYCLLEQ